MARPLTETLPRRMPPGTPVRVVHAKPWKKVEITMRTTVQGWEDGLLVLARQFSAGGTYDSLNAPKRAGDYGTIEVAPGSWVLRRTYRRADGSLIGELFNLQTPAVMRSGEVRYTDLEIDVMRLPNGEVRVVDEADLARAVEVGGITPAVAERARTIAYRLADILRAGGDWRQADAAERPAGPATA